MYNVSSDWADDFLAVTGDDGVTPDVDVATAALV